MFSLAEIMGRDVAQWVEFLTRNHKAVGSIPSSTYRTWWHKSVPLSLERQKQEDQKSTVLVKNTACSCKGPGFAPVVGMRIASIDYT